MSEFVKRTDVKNTNLYHGARFYEIPALFPKAGFIQIHQSDPNGSETVQKSDLTQTTYFSDLQQIAKAYPMYERKSPSDLMFPLGIILSTDTNIVAVRRIAKEETKLILSPDERSTQHVRICEHPVQVKDIKSLLVLIYPKVINEMKKMSLNCPSIVTGDAISPFDLKRFHREGLIITQRIKKHYPNIKVALEFVDMDPQNAKKIIYST